MKEENYLATGFDAKWMLGHAMEAIVKGNEKVWINFFKNESKKNSKEPDWTCRTGALWIKQKNEKKEDKEIELLVKEWLEKHKDD